VFGAVIGMVAWFWAAVAGGARVNRAESVSVRALESP
jgi:hypothetical protein